MSGLGAGILNYRTLVQIWRGILKESAALGSYTHVKQECVVKWFSGASVFN